MQAWNIFLGILGNSHDIFSSFKFNRIALFTSQVLLYTSIGLCMFLVTCWWLISGIVHYTSLELRLMCIALQCSAVQFPKEQCSAVKYSTVQCSTVQYTTVQCSSVHYTTVQCNAVQCSADSLANRIRWTGNP